MHQLFVEVGGHSLKFDEISVTGCNGTSSAASDESVVKIRFSVIPHWPDRYVLYLKKYVCKMKFKYPRWRPDMLRSH